jgi:hypothetical protein
MQELITRLTEKAGISNEQAQKAVIAIKDFVKEKFPMMSGAVDNLLGTDASPATNFTEAPLDPSVPATAPQDHGSILDKISDFIPGQTGQNVEDFAKNAGEKAGDLFDAAKDKLGGYFGGEKK